MSENDFINKGHQAFNNGNKKYLSSSTADKDEKLLSKITDYVGGQSIPASKNTKEEAWSKIEDSILSNKNKPNVVNPIERFFSTKWINRAAAFIGVLVGFYTLWFFTNDIEQISPKDGTLEYTFPDGSIAILKKGSRIQFLKKGFDGHIYLDGHAQFYVNDDGDEDKKFEVKTDRSVIYASDGSKFDLRDDKHIFQLTNIGKYDIKYHEEHSVDKEIKILNEGDMLETFSTSLLQPIQRGVRHTDWVKGYFAYTKAPLLMVISDLEKQFGIEVKHKLQSEKILFTGAFYDDKLEGALTSICSDLSLNYILEGEKVLLKMNK